MVEEYYEGLGGVAHMQHADGTEFFACNERQVIEKKVEHDGHRHQVARLRDGQYAALRSERRRDARDGPGQMLEIGRGRKQACIDRIIARISEGWTVSAAHANQWRDKQHWRGEGWRDPVQKIWDRHIDGARRLGRSL
jgi:hypothetical protein